MRDQVNEYLDGTLGERDGGRLEAHLAGCSACRGFANTLEATIRAARELPRELLPAAARARLQQMAANSGFAGRNGDLRRAHLCQAEREVSS